MESASNIYVKRAVCGFFTYRYQFNLVFIIHLLYPKVNYKKRTTQKAVSEIK